MLIEEMISETLVRHYSDENKYIRQIETGNKYEDAIDVVPCRYTYEETDEPIEPVDPTDTEYIQAAKIMLGEED